MAWNEPGKDDKDPWGNNRGNDGPPDLDDVLRDQVFISSNPLNKA